MTRAREGASPVTDRVLVQAKLLDWMVEMAKAVGARRSPREDVAAVFERLAGDGLAAEYEMAVADTKASAAGRKKRTAKAGG